MDYKMQNCGVLSKYLNIFGINILIFLMEHKKADLYFTLIMLLFLFLIFL